MKQKTVFVGLSGGVDSAVSAALLKKQGYEVVGVFIKTWHPDFLECNEEGERRDAMRVAAFLDIPFLTFDFEDVYKREVADYMIREYKAGRTPNPDVMCNKEVKFGAFLKKALSMGADYVATGHYASKRNQKNSLAFLHSTNGTFRLKNSSDFFSRKDFPNDNFERGRFQPPAGGIRKNYYLDNLLKGIDPSKDQSYFLWTLRQRQLNKILFPIGHLKKTQVRKRALKFKLPVAEKKDSQGICFLGAVDLKEFLKHYIKEKKGKVLNEKGEEIGFHDGVVFHTLGERHGFTITRKSPKDRPYYVVDKDVKKNILVVSQYSYPASPYVGGGEGGGITLENTNWISGNLEPEKNYTAQIRYHGEFISCRVKVAVGNRATVIFTKPAMAAPGQSVVVYDKDVCLGGGVIV